MRTMNMADLLTAAAERHPEKVALRYGEADVGARLTFSELDAEVDKVFAGLAALGVTQGDRVAIAMPNVPRFVAAYLGALRAGAVAVPLNAMLTAIELTRILNDCEPLVLLGAGLPGEAAAGAAADVASLRHVIAETNWDESFGQDASPPKVSLSDDDLAVLAYTSGTTGQPKGAMLTHANLLANLDQQMAIPEEHVRPDDVLLMVLPLFHIFGLNVPLGLLLKNAATGVLLERFDPVGSLRLIEKEKVTIVFGAPPMYQAWVSTPGADQYDLSSVRIAVSGAAPLPLAVLQSFHEIFGVEIDEGYGLTESAPTLTSNRMAAKPKPGSVGKPLPGIDMRIINESGDDVELGDPGEIVVRGPNVFKGYWNQPEQTAAVLRDGWLYTGDVAVKDEEGFIHLVDRKRDLVIVSGFNVYPAEVEAALLENPAVQEAAVIGAPHPYRGETLKAFVVLAPGAAATESELAEDVHQRIARFKWPESIQIVDDLPHLLSGKVLRRALRQDVPPESAPV
ncbi:MAG: long-chain fatty acid--CoA ligase [Actinomycetota bacterium]|nr:long-chain fatty acid--CoA ligase [Actinomycetota bacterium]